MHVIIDHSVDIMDGDTDKHKHQSNPIHIPDNVDILDIKRAFQTGINTILYCLSSIIVVFIK